ncbi:S49 family peptidase [Paraburkholderia sp. UCT31]|uniref:S49 family peptidase n=1 Tax=Paraburkholderia sp. UCT31 TaxID=2615209 RepID=UPI0016557594|nr:S49 family peptidase [Paraburkholderia sp. UCT31]MBC8737308.1 S49 family peptidase [Paraburkholderia sp. UCT31]
MENTDFPTPANQKPSPLEYALVHELLKETRRARKWRNVRWLAAAAVVGIGLIRVVGPASDSGLGAASEPHASLVKIEGEIAPDSEASAARLIPAISEAFDDATSKGVLIEVNSPGGTPVQAMLIHDHILRMKKLHPDKKVVVVGEDYLASGAYMVAVAADKIYVSKATVTGSIGVVTRGFGAVGALEKLGIERRILTAGENKARMDPFLPVQNRDKEKMQQMLTKLHGQFIDIVKSGRKGKLKGDESELFSGDFWTGEEAVGYGLVDATGDVLGAAQAEFGVTSVKEYSPAAPLWQKITKEFGTQVALKVPAFGMRVEALAPGA